MKLKAKFKEYFYRSFRVHGKDEYGELFTRGLSNREGINTVYPWFYARVLAVLTVVYTIYAVINSILPGAGDWETFYFVGGAFLDITLLVLLFELYPYKDFSLIVLFFVCLIGGSFSDIISAFIYHFHSLEITLNGWKLAAIAGVGEEIAKAVPAIVCIAVLKKKDKPFIGFMIGAAVGTWFSLTENANYIHNAYPVYYRIITASVRALGAPFSHAMWSALIGWAFCKFKKPFINIRFYAVVLLCMALHFCIDMPLWDYVIILFAEAAVCGLAAFIFGVTIIVKERKKALPALQPSEVQENSSCKFNLSQITNITAYSLGAALCALLLVLSAVYGTASYTKTAYSPDEFIAFAQNGYVLNPNLNRIYDLETEGENYFAQYEQGVLTYAEQCETDGEITYIYCYRLKDAVESVTDDETISYGERMEENDITDGESEEVEKVLHLTAVKVMLEIDGKPQTFDKIFYSFPDEDIFISVYVINPDFHFSRLKSENGKIIVYTEVDRLSWQAITVLSATCAVALGGVITILVLRKKSRGTV